MIAILYSFLLQAKIGGEPLIVRDKWQVWISDMTDKKWEERCSSHLVASPVDNNKLTQLYIIHQTYLHPTRLYKMGRKSMLECLRCYQDEADFCHLIWYVER